jgi:RHS repeat-associated protein
VFNDQVVAQRTVTSTSNVLVYLHADHLGSVSAVTSGTSTALVSSQTYKPYGEARTGSLTQTELNFTGQRRYGTGLLFYNARYYEPAIGRFISADSIVPGTAAGSGRAVATVGSGAKTNLTVDFHESGFVSQLNGHHAFTQAYSRIHFRAGRRMLGKHSPTRRADG